ncbi:uncharacterized protein LOC104891174 [Beta vulgaris subsp. vulgaris]|uniref:uncharacterized protein LOC104891174 n=1 Tax=Beta vulgaris subsp. vulgaris TaxID=3555 RepID=UPI0020370F93|nr:uncharacterized protein LOC104891174 [Beta vulgaris subsp. vulgaris]
MTSPPIQKDIITCCAKETTKCIIEELGDDYFAILADESSDVSQKEQLALLLRFVHCDSSKIMERFSGIVHVSNTTALSLQNAIVSLLVEHSSSPSMIGGQGYDGARNMRGEILANLLNVIGVSCKRRDMLRQSQAQQVAQALEVGEIDSGMGLNQELGLKRPGDTRWGSHFKCLLNIINLFPSIVEQHTNDLCVALQRKEQDIVNAMGLVDSTKNVLRKMREQGWETLLHVQNYFIFN